jgi:hypothetical protein
MMRDTSDPAQRVVGALARGVHLADDRMFCAGHRGQRRHRGADTVAAVMDTYRLQRARRIWQPQFGYGREQFEHVVEAPIVDGRRIEMNQVGDRQPVRRS